MTSQQQRDHLRRSLHETDPPCGSIKREIAIADSAFEVTGTRIIHCPQVMEFHPIEKPTEEGYYWVRTVFGCLTIAEIVDRKGGLSIHSLDRTFSPTDGPVVWLKDAGNVYRQFYGPPIPQPEKTPTGP